MEISELMPILGGVASRRIIVSVTSRKALDEALAVGHLVRVAHGRYGVPGVQEGTRLALKVSGHVCLVSAALSHGWKVKLVPDLPQVAVPKDRRIDTATRSSIELHWIDLGEEQVEGLATTAATTLLMCGRRLPFDEALAIADSALRDGFPARELTRLAEKAKGPGSARLRRVAAAADGRAANPFESVLRAICLGVPGLGVEPQVRIRGGFALDVRPDLVDRRLRIVLEADSFEWHGDRAALRKDARRYDLLVADGWRVLRFAWEDVMHDQDWVRSVLARTVALSVLGLPA
ncbi:MAG: endonuclease domain-containing protein [Nocardioides sp.]|nr:endonuclease domain-containing protein [Nocardioides sp.]